MLPRRCQTAWDPSGRPPAHVRPWEKVSSSRCFVREVRDVFAGARARWCRKRGVQRGRARALQEHRAKWVRWCGRLVRDHEALRDTPVRLTVTFATSDMTAAGLE